MLNVISLAHLLLKTPYNHTQFLSLFLQLMKETNPVDKGGSFERQQSTHMWILLIAITVDPGITTSNVSQDQSPSDCTGTEMCLLLLKTNTQVWNKLNRKVTINNAYSVSQ